MCTRFVYRGDNIITGFNFDIDIVEWNHKVINTKDCFYIGIMRPDGMRHSYHGVNRNGNVGTLLYVHGNLSGTYQDSKDCITIADLVEKFIQAEVSFDDVLQILKERKIVYARTEQNQLREAQLTVNLEAEDREPVRILDGIREV